MGKSTISMPMFHSYVKLPEGTHLGFPGKCICQWWICHSWVAGAKAKKSRHIRNKQIRFGAEFSTCPSGNSRVCYSENFDWFSYLQGDWWLDFHVEAVELSVYVRLGGSSQAAPSVITISLCFSLSLFLSAQEAHIATIISSMFLSSTPFLKLCVQYYSMFYIPMSNRFILWYRPQTNWKLRCHSFIPWCLVTIILYQQSHGIF